MVVWPCFRTVCGRALPAPPRLIVPRDLRARAAEAPRRRGHGGMPRRWGHGATSACSAVSSAGCWRACVCACARAKVLSLARGQYLYEPEPVSVRATIYPRARTYAWRGNRAPLARLPRQEAAAAGKVKVLVVRQVRASVFPLATLVLRPPPRALCPSRPGLTRACTQARAFAARVPRRGWRGMVLQKQGHERAPQGRRARTQVCDTSARRCGSEGKRGTIAPPCPSFGSVVRCWCVGGWSTGSTRRRQTATRRARAPSRVTPCLISSSRCVVVGMWCVWGCWGVGLWVCGRRVLQT